MGFMPCFSLLGSPLVFLGSTFASSAAPGRLEALSMAATPTASGGASGGASPLLSPLELQLAVAP